MNRIKIMLLGIAIILLGIAISTMNFFGWCGGVLGIVIVLIGFFMNDRDR
ncbi:hypothetical protein [Youxingia wuxianensis]|mgnify:CR=1 FL=1|uniref:Uncharacterized protein n=1 Tax=Youxingia wuxianensis TaxID=2763678 RepID=A0A926ELZ4_9FIRM|nr:hypothetical protein [Youxingia wuxianensis]MBC8585041.1 hypothetical protein [Youxingia wuxianensis]